MNIKLSIKYILKWNVEHGVEWILELILCYYFIINQFWSWNENYSFIIFKKCVNIEETVKFDIWNVFCNKIFFHYFL